MPIVDSIVNREMPLNLNKYREEEREGGVAEGSEGEGLQHSGLRKEEIKEDSFQDGLR